MKKIVKVSLFLFATLTLSVSMAQSIHTQRTPASVSQSNATSEISHDEDDVQLVISNNRLSAAYGGCRFSGDGAAIPSAVNVHYEHGEFKKLELSAFNGNCVISLDEFEKDPQNPNMIFRDDTGCTLSVSVVKRATSAQGFRMLSPDDVNNDNAMLNIQTVPGTCNRFCPQLKSAKKVWQIMMNPRTDKCE